MVAFGGYLMPQQYTGILAEHRAVREDAGAFDISHMTQFEVTGAEAAEALDRTVSCDVRGLAPGRARYGLLLNDRGGIIDDLIVYRRSRTSFLIVGNAARRDADFLTLRERLGASVRDASDDYAMFALQGPRAEAACAQISGPVVRGLSRFAFAEGFNVSGIRATVARTGYTGEDGYEILCRPEGSERVWRGMEAVGAHPCGLGARDLLRLEAAYPLWGHELNEETTPLEAGLAFAVAWRSEFVGRAALERQRRGGVPRRLVGLVVDGKAIPRHGTPVLDGRGQTIGAVTSGNYSPIVGAPVALAYVPPPPARRRAGAKEPVSIEARGRRVPVRLVPLPFYRRREIDETSTAPRRAPRAS